MKYTAEWYDNVKTTVDIGGNVCISELAQEVKNNTEFDVEQLKMKEARRIVTARLRNSAFRDKDGNRKYVPVKGKDCIINIETCTDRELVMIVVNQYDDMVEGDMRFLRKGRKRLRQIEGQMNLFASNSGYQQEAVAAN